MFPNVKVVGAHFRGSDAKEASASLEKGTTLRLEREPENAYDSFAIKVFLEDLWIGYIEKGQAAWIAGQMDDGEAFEAKVTGHEDVPNASGRITSYPIVTVQPA